MKSKIKIHQLLSQSIWIISFCNISCFDSNTKINPEIEKTDFVIESNNLIEYADSIIFVYEKPDQNSVVVDTINFLESFNLLGSAKISNELHDESESWKFIFFNNKNGFIKAASYTTGDRYFISNSHDVNYSLYTSSQDSIINVYLFNSKLEKLDSIEYLRTDNGFRLEPAGFESSLKDIKEIMYLETYRESCPGGGYQHYFGVSKDQKLVKIYSTVSYGESIYYEGNSIYLPVIRNGYKSSYYSLKGEFNNVNYITGKSTNLISLEIDNIPSNELFVVNEFVKEDLNEEDDFYELTTLYDKWDYFHWDGNKAKLIKSEVKINKKNQIKYSSIGE